MIDVVRTSLAKHFDSLLVDELLEAYNEAKRNYYEGGHRLSAVEGGRFCEAVYRMLEEKATGAYTALGRQLDTEALTRRLAGLSTTQFSRSFRIHIPRALRVVYDIRNNRDTAHLADGIDPNIQDATLVIANLNWILAEFVRLYHSVSATDAEKIVEEISTRKVPVIQEFGDFPRVLRVDLRAGDMVLILLYHAGSGGVAYSALSEWVRPKMRNNLRRTLRVLDDKAHIHAMADRFVITNLGKRFVEEQKLLQPA